MTNGGARPNTPCVFPFKQTKQTKVGCSTFESETPWCSTKVNESGYHVGGEWGYCSPGCPEDFGMYVWMH